MFVCVQRERVSVAYCMYFLRDVTLCLCCCMQVSLFVLMCMGVCVCAFQCMCASHCQQLVLRCRQESPVTHITASSHCVLNQLCFSMLSKTLSHTHDACLRACVCVCARARAHTCTAADVRLFVRVHRSGRVCVMLP